MKMILCNDIKLGALCEECLDVDQLNKWQNKRKELFAELTKNCATADAGYLLLFGDFFGQTRISESVIDCLFNTALENSTVKVILMLNNDDYKRATYRSELPDNLYIKCYERLDSFADGNISIKAEDGRAEIFLGDETSFEAIIGKDGTLLKDASYDDVKIPSMEPIGFDDNESSEFGYSIIEWSDDGIEEYKEVRNQYYEYRVVDIPMLGSDDNMELFNKINRVVSELGENSFVRLNICGTLPFATAVNTPELKEHLQRTVFFAEIFDNAVMDYNSDLFENDISLKSEFTRMAMNDGTLSESERHRLICCGWNALIGREVE